MNNSRINAIEQIEANLRNLEAYGYNTSHIWAEHNAWLLTLDTQQVTEFDKLWATRNVEPTNITEHLAEEHTRLVPIVHKTKRNKIVIVGMKEEKYDDIETLRAATAFPDRQYTLSSGQRTTLKERHGLTPAKVVVLTNVTTYPGTNIIWSLTIKSAEHIDPRRRRHVLVEAVIQPASQFFAAAAEREKEAEIERDEADAKRVKKGEEPRSAKQKALTYFE